MDTDETKWWGVIFDRKEGPRLDEIPKGTFAFRKPTTGQWFIMWRSP